MTSVLKHLERWGAERGWIGPDPYEGLNSPLGGMARSRRSRQAVIQLYKRLPFRPPAPLAAAPEPNAKALALALSGYASAAGRSLPGASESLDRIPIALRRMMLPSRVGSGWGYHFDAQTRHLYYTRETPNAVATCFVVGALIDASEATGEDSHAELALGARRYLCSLLKHAPTHGPFFAYVSAGSELIHNANLLVCAALARLHELDSDKAIAAKVRDAARTTLALQRDDGSWPYGERDDLRWMDNFHTAYILEGLSYLEGILGIGAEALARGLPTWRASFFEPDGGARMYPDRRYPLEAHSYASAIDLLCTSIELSNDREAGIFALRVAESAIRELWLPDRSRFAFKRTRMGLNRREFMRWTNAPMFRALARLASVLSASAEARDKAEPVETD
jgi:hypothetical protein